MYPCVIVIIHGEVLSLPLPVKLACACVLLSLSLCLQNISKSYK